MPASGLPANNAGSIATNGFLIIPPTYGNIHVLVRVTGTGRYYIVGGN